MYRQLTDLEISGLSSKWENPTVDTSKYYQNVFTAYEVLEAEYLKHRSEGGLCQKYEGRYYIA